MNINRYQAAKNLQPARSLRTAPNPNGRNVLGDFGYPPHLVDTAPPPHEHQPRAGAHLQNGGGGTLPVQAHQRSSSQSRKHDVLRTPQPGAHGTGAGRSITPASPGSLTFNASTLTVGSLYQVTVSYVQNGPKQFMVQLHSCHTALTQMMSALARVPLRAINRKLQLGMACLARFSQNHMVYRALITALGQDGNCTVSFVDYGHSETVHPGSLFEIPPEFLRYEIFSTRFALSNVRRLEDVNADVAGIFSRLVAGKVLSLKVTPPEGAAFVSYCELYESGENLFNRLQKLCREQVYRYPALGSLQRGASYNVVIRYIESCSQFYVHRLDNVAVFDKMMDDLIVHCQSSGTPAVVGVGDAYAVSLDPNDYYRAEVVETDPKIRVRLIDYGNIITAQRVQLKRLSPSFVHQRPEAFECCLEGFEGSTSDDLSTPQLEMLSEGVDKERKPFKLIVCDVRDGKTIVNLLDESETPVLNVSKKLLKLNNPVKFVKDSANNQQKQQQQQQQQQNNKRLSGGAVGTAKGDQLGTSGDSGKAPLSSSGVSSGQGDCIDLTNDEWSGGPPLPGNQSTAYDLQTGGNLASPPRNARSGGGGNAGYGRDSNHSSRDSSTSNSKQDVKRVAATGAATIAPAGARNDIPRFNKERTQMPYYYEHDDRCAEPNSPPANVQGSVGGGVGGNEAKRNERNKMDVRNAAQDHANTAYAPVVSAESNAQPADEFLPYRSTFPEQTVPLDTKQDVVLSWWYSPEQFYVRLRSEEDKYHEMMKQLQKYYRNKSNQQLHQQQLQQQQSTGGGKAAKPSTGSIVVVRHPKHNAFYRGRVLKYNESAQKYKVELVDGGNKLALSANDLWLVERRFTRLAPMAIACALPDVRLRCEVKELQSRIDSYISNDKQFEIVFVERVEGGKYHCKVNSLGRDLKEQLLEDNLIAQVYVDIDLTRLKGQTLKVQLVEVKSLNDLRVQLLGHQAIFCCRTDGCDSTLSADDTVAELREKWLQRYCLAQVVDVSNDEKLILSLLIPTLTGQPEPTIAEMPVLMSNFNVYVTHVESTNCLYVQNARWNEAITKLADELYEFYEKQQSTVPCANLAMNEMCAARSQDDGNWYRAKIVSLQDIEKIEVLLVDYGFREQIKHSELKALDAKFLEHGAFAHRVHLPMAAIAGVEEERIKSEISELTGSYELSLKVVEFRNGIWIVDITSNDYSIVSVLKDRQLVADLDYETILNQRQSSTPTPGGPARPSIEDHEAKHQKIRAKICHVDNPSQLFIQLESDLRDLHQLQETLQIIASSLPPLRDFSADRYCIAQYSADDLWYRALIIDSHDDLIIQFVDFGHTDIVTSNKKSTLRDINDDLMKWKIYAKQCAMLIQPASAEVEGSGAAASASKGGRKKTAAWKEVATTILRALDEVEVHFLAEAQGVHYISVRSGEKDIAEMLVEKKLATRLLYVPSGQRCFTSHTESIDEFYLQLERDVNPLDVMGNYLADVSKFADVEEPKVNMICLAEFADDTLWYRVQVLAIPKPGEYEVQFIDYGNRATVQKLKQLEPSIAELTRLCAKCALRLPENVKSWSEAAQEKFAELTAMGQTVFTVQLHSPGTSFATVELFHEGRNIVDQLVALCEKGTGSATDAMSASFFLGDDNRLDDSYQLEDDKVHVSHVNSPAEFFIQFNNSFDALRNMEELLAAKAKHCEPIAEGDIRNGLFCLAQLVHNRKYCRALVLAEVQGGQATYHHVLLVDYGYRAAATDLRKMPPSIEEMSRLAKKCCLEHYLPTDEITLGSVRWSRLRSRLTELADSGKAVFTFEIVRNDCDPLIIRLFTPGGVNVEDLLREDAVDEIVVGDDLINSASGTSAAGSGGAGSSDTLKRAKPKQAFFRANSDLEFLENN